MLYCKTYKSRYCEPIIDLESVALLPSGIKAQRNKAGTHWGKNRAGSKTQRCVDMNVSHMLSTRREQLCQSDSVLARDENACKAGERLGLAGEV